MRTDDYRRAFILMSADTPATAPGHSLGFHDYASELMPELIGPA
jgi:hypothetical protein